MYAPLMWGRWVIFYALGMVFATALTVVGTYYVVEWLVPPLNMYGAYHSGTGDVSTPPGRSPIQTH
jgi:hypothetical protein